MTISIILALLALSVPVIIRLAKGRAAIPRIEQLRSVDLRAFRNLMDPEEEDYLRQHLPAAEFRRIQRERQSRSRGRMCGHERRTREEYRP